MSSPYDQTLLDEAPRATRAQLQEGYNVDLLEPPPPRRTPSVRTPPVPIPQPTPVPLTPGIAESGSREKFVSSPSVPTAPKSTTSFWRTRNGIITIFIIIIVIVGAVVGGAVGGTIKKNNVQTSTGTENVSSSPTSSTSSTPTTTATSGSQGIGTKTLSSTAPIATQTGSNIGMEVGSGGSGTEGIAA